MGSPSWKDQDPEVSLGPAWSPPLLSKSTRTHTAVNWCNHLGNLTASTNNLQIPCDPAIPLLGT